MDTVVNVFPIKGAVVVPEMEKTELNGEPAYKFPAANSEYRYGMKYNGALWASKDGKDFVFAVHLVQEGD